MFNCEKCWENPCKCNKSEGHPGFNFDDDYKSPSYSEVYSLTQENNQLKERIVELEKTIQEHSK